MTTRAELAAHAAAVTMVVEEAQSDLDSGWNGLGLTASALATSSALSEVEDLFAGIVKTWGEVSSTLGADWYDELRDRADAPGQFHALTVEPLIPDQVRGVVLRAAQPVDPDGLEVETERMNARLQGAMQRLIRAPEREVILEASKQDPARPYVARVPMGAETCAFCLVMASRGAVYRGNITAGAGPEVSEQDKYHDWCDCEALTVWPGDELPEHYDPAALLRVYKAARRASDSGDLKVILAALRQREGIR